MVTPATEILATCVCPALGPMRQQNRAQDASIFVADSRFDQVLNSRLYG